MKISQLTNKEYHAEIDHYSSSQLKDYLKSPVKAKDRRWQQSNSKDTGTALHALMEGNFEDECVVGESPTKIGKILGFLKERDQQECVSEYEWENIRRTHNWSYEDYLTAYVCLQEKRVLISSEQYEVANGMHQAIKSSPLLSEVWSHDGQIEDSFFGEIDGLKVKVRPDLIANKTIYDWKSIFSFTPDDISYMRTIKLRRAINNYGYHLSAALYIDLVSQFQEIDKFRLVFVESHAPYQVAVVELSDKLLKEGRKKYKEAIEVIKRCNLMGYEETFSEIIEI